MTEQRRSSHGVYSKPQRVGIKVFFIYFFLFFREDLLAMLFKVKEISIIVLIMDEQTSIGTSFNKYYKQHPG